MDPYQQAPQVLPVILVNTLILVVITSVLALLVKRSDQDVEPAGDDLWCGSITCTFRQSTHG